MDAAEDGGRSSKRIGAAVSTICDQIHRAGGRRILGVLSLTEIHGPGVVEDTAKVVLDLGVPTHRFVRRYREGRPPVPLILKQVDPSFGISPCYRVFLLHRRDAPSCTLSRSNDNDR